MRKTMTALCLVLAAAAPARAATFGLTIGVDLYHHYPNLAGATNDARMIAQALREIGARDVVTLLDDEASKPAIRAAWDRLLSRAAPGDVIVLSFAGHGDRMPEDAANTTEADRRDDAFILGGFSGPDSLRTGGLGAVILDDEIGAWLAAAYARDVRVVVVADSCYSGTMTRSADGRTRRMARSRFLGMEGMEAPAPMTRPEMGEAAEQLPNVAFFAATSEYVTIQERPINGYDHGVLSYAFASALMGGRGMATADANGDGVYDWGEMRDYVDHAVEQFSDQSQGAALLPLGAARGVPMLTRDVVAVADPGPAPVGIPPVRLAVLGGGGVSVPLSGAMMVGEGDAPDLLFDPASGDVLSGSDVVARQIGGGDLQHVIDKFALLAALKARAAGAGLTTVLNPDKPALRLGDRISITTEGRAHEYLLALDLTNAGAVHYLYPRSDLKSHTPRRSLSDRWVFYTEITTPLGGDHVVVFASDRPLDALAQALERGDLAAVARDLEALLGGATYQIGIHPVLTTR